ncbi:UNVERIFIED_CONTAM: hypothetical protein Sindi_1466100 [Sesamum indicum]
MGTSTRAATFWLMAAITVTIIVVVIGFLPFSPPWTSAGGDGDGDKNNYNKPHEGMVKLWMWCLKQKSLFPYPRGPFSSRGEESNAVLCKDMFRLMGYAYEWTGKLPIDYVEALKLYYRNNQTAIDMRVCSLSLQRCPNETLRLVWHFDDAR